MIKLQPYLYLMRLDKPIGIWLLLWPVWWSLWLSYQSFPPLSVICLFTSGVIVTRSLGCVLNDIVDRNIDDKVTRTQNRPLAAKQLTLGDTLPCVLILSVLALLILWLLSPSLIWLAILCLLSMAIYPFSKRWIKLPQCFLGYTFSLGIPFVFLYVQHQINLQCILLFIINYLWVISYDTYYAIVDRADDLHIGVQSTAVYWGNHAGFYTLICQVTMAFLWVILLYHNSLPLLSKIMIVIAHFYLFLLWYHQHQSPNTQTNFMAFKNSHWYGTFIWLALIIGLH